jgi:hypothetical protein
MDSELKVKEIPSEASLFRGIHKDCIYPQDPDFILPKAFCADRSDFGMSTDWQCEDCQNATQSLMYVKEERRMNYGIAQIKDQIKGKIEFYLPTIVQFETGFYFLFPLGSLIQ